MIFIKYILAVFVIFKTIDCLSQHDLCTSNEKRCQKLNDTIRCTSNDCGYNSDWSTQCGHSFCSKDILTCEIFKMWQDKVEEKVKSENWKDKLAVKFYRKFKIDIKKCPVSEQFEWKLSDVCSNDIKCSITTKKSTDLCNCNNNSGKLTFKCNDYFCAADEQTCMGFMSLLSSSPFDFKKNGEIKLSKCFTSRRF